MTEDGRKKDNRPSRWPWGLGICVIALFAGVAGLAAICLAVKDSVLAASVAAILSVAWLGAGVALLVAGFGAKRIRAETNDYVVKEALAQLTKAASKKDPDGQRAETLDRLDRLALKALENRDRRP